MKKLLFAMALMFCATVFMPSESRANAIEPLKKAHLEAVQPEAPSAEALDGGVGVKVETLDNGDTAVSVFFMFRWVVILVL